MYIAFTRFRVTSTGKFSIHWLRDEFAPNCADGATRFDSLEDCENALDIAIENVRNRARNLSSGVRKVGV